MKIDESKFKHRIGDEVRFYGAKHKVAAYYFSQGFNDYNHPYGYVLQGQEGFHSASKHAYLEDGSRLFNAIGKKNYIYVEEHEI